MRRLPALTMLLIVPVLLGEKCFEDPPGPVERVPDAPTIGQALAGNGSAEIAFTAPADTGTQPITLYAVTCTGSNVSAQTATGTASPITVTGLTNGVAYACTVVAVNAVGNSDPSNGVSVTPATTPGTPTIGTITAGNASASVAFTAPQSNGGAAITNYTATCTPTGGSGVTGTGTSSPVTVNGLTNGTQYGCNVYATNARGNSTASASANVTPATVPGAPTIGAATAGNGQASIAFTAPTSNGGSAITTYAATCAGQGQTTAQANNTVSPIVVTSMTNGVTYVCLVRAANALGAGAASGEVNVTPVGPPGIPTNVAATPGNAQASVAFTAPTNTGGSAITGYTANCAVTTGGGHPAQTVNGTVSPIVVTSLVNGVSWSCSVRAVNDIGFGTYSNPVQVTPFTVPGAPTIGTATAGNGEATVNFTAPSSTGGSAISAYTATCSASGQTTRTGSGTASATSIAVAQLTNGVQYSCSVTATNAAGPGASSGTVDVTPVAPTAPGAPTIGAATAGNTQASVGFTAPASNGGSAITGYTASCTPAGGGTAITGTGSASATTITVTGLTNGTAYNCTVVATNAAGNSAASGQVSVTPVAPPFCSYSYDQLNGTLGFNSFVLYTCTSTTRSMKSNQVPDHAPGAFPNGGNPHAISAQTSGPPFTTAYATTLSPTISNQTGTAIAHTTGYAINGVKFDPATAETCPPKSYCPGTYTATFNVEALGQTIFSAGVDNSNAHVQPNGAYHYHGIPQGYMDYLAPGQSTGQKMIMVGFAVDGFPVYAKWGYTDPNDMTSPIIEMTSSWQLKSSPSTGRPDFATVANGTFTQDWEYVENSGKLDQCNGRVGKTPEYPNGIYHYFITTSFPYIQRCVKGSYISLP